MESSFIRPQILTDSETKYITNEFELIPVIWSVEQFKNYVNGVTFGNVSDHEALQGVLRLNKGNKTFSSRWTRLVNIDFAFWFYHCTYPGRMLGKAGYLSSRPSEYERLVAKVEFLLYDWFLINVKEDVTPNWNDWPKRSN